MDIKQIVSTTLDLISVIAPGVKIPSTIITIIDSLTALVPAIQQEAADLKPTVLNVIATLRDNTATPDEQMDRLDAIEAKLDADFDAAASAAATEDAESDKPK